MNVIAPVEELMAKSAESLPATTDQATVVSAVAVPIANRFSATVNVAELVIFAAVARYRKRMIPSAPAPPPLLSSRLSRCDRITDRKNVMNMEEEAKARWGQTPAYKQSQERLAKYSPEDIEEAAQEMHAATLQVLGAMQRGLPADSEAAIAGAEAHRQAISKWWYDCTFEIHTGLAEMYLADERFRKNYEDQAEGLAQYLRDATFANAALT